MSATPNNPATGSLNLNPVASPANSPAVPNFPRSDHRDLETLLALSSLHEQIHRRRAQELNKGRRLSPEDAWELKHLVQDEVLQLVADRAMTVTGADGIAVALVDKTGIVCRATAGKIAPERGARLDPHSGFSGACLRTGEIVRCDDTEKDSRVSSDACRRLGTRSMVAVPLVTPQATIGVLEAFSTDPHGFNDSDVRSLSILSDLILDAMKPEEEYKLAEISRQVVGNAPASKRSTLDVPGIWERIELKQPEVKTPPEIEKPLLAASEIEKASLPLRRESEKQNATLVLFSEYQQPDTSRPGLKLVIFLVILAVAVGSALWWQIRRNSNHKRADHNPSKAIASATARVPDNASAPQTSSLQDYDSAAQAQPSVPNAVIPDTGKTSLPKVTGIRHWSSEGSSTVAIDLEDQVQYEAHRLTSPERIYVDLLDTKLDRELFGKTIDVNDPVLQRIRIAQPRQGVTRVVLDTKGASNYSVSMEQSPVRLVIEVGKLGSKVGPNSRLNLFGSPQPLEGNLNGPSTAKAVPNSSAAETVKAQNAIAAANAPASRHAIPDQPIPALTETPSLTIVLDAGHGGWDFGTVGRKGLLEKDLVLDIVQRLGSLLERGLNAKVIYTRQDDSYVALEKRAEIANLSQAKLFVSIHANYSGLTSARGVETYYTNTYSSVKARPADDDTEVSLQNVDWTRVDIREKVRGSHRLAECVQQALYGTIASKNPGIRDRGVKEAQYVVLTGTSMPAILAEVSFVSSPTDEGELQSAVYRQRIAEALYKGIARYREGPHHTTMASSSEKPTPGDP